MDDIRQLILSIISSFDLGIKHGSFLYELLVLAIVVLFVLLIHIILSLIFVRGMSGLSQKISWLRGVTSDPLLKVLQRTLVNLFTISIFIGLLTLPFPTGGAVYNALWLISKLCQTYFFFRLLVGIVDLSRHLLQRSPKYRDNPMIALLEAVKVLIIFLGGLVVISLIFGINMTTIFGSLAALSAILMLIFQDTILGFAASIRLITNDMVHVGDWITVPGKEVDGDVIEITLTTVKVKGFDNCIYTIPPYELVGNVVQNWNAMQASGARLCNRAIYMDMTSIRLADQELIERIRQIPALADAGILGDGAKPERETNLGLFRAYVEKYLSDSDYVDHSYPVMCYQKPMTESSGLPVFVRFFTSTSAWASHEASVAEIFEHLLSVIPLFGLRVYQRVSSGNLPSLPALPVEAGRVTDEAK